MSVKVIFQPEGKKGIVKEGTTITQAAYDAGVAVDSPCGALGKCGKCRVHVIEGVAESTSVEKEIFSTEELNKGWRLACRTKIQQDSVIFIPRSTRLQTQKILDVGVEKRILLNPNCRKKFMELIPVSLENPIADLDNLRFSLSSRSRRGNKDLSELFRRDKGSLNQYSIDVDLLKELSVKIRNSNWKITAIIVGNEIIDIESDDTEADPLYGIAFDIGTTTVVGAIVDLSTGIVVGSSADMNSQIIYGDDVISRITFSLISPNGTGKLQELIVSLINKIIKEASINIGIRPELIYEMTVVGNTTMEHLFLGIEPKPLSYAPFIPTLGKTGISVKAKDLGVNINPNGIIYVMPVIAGWVGGDTVGVILATNIHKSKHIKLAIDIGTNGELVLGNKDRLLSCSCAAGPALEGAHITYGMRASIGAIERVDIIDKDIKIGVIGATSDKGVIPRGFCGSGVIDAIAALLDLGVIDETGLMKDYDELKGKVTSRILDRLKQSNSGSEFVFAELPDKEISITQRDIREVQLSKGAILAGAKILLKDYGISKEDIYEVLIAGAFGNYIRKEKALRIGLIPDVELSKIIFTGNAAEEGSRIALISKDARNEAIEVAKKVEHVNLGGRSDFQEEFGNSMLFPEK